MNRVRRGGWLIGLPLFLFLVLACTTSRKPLGNEVPDNAHDWGLTEEQMNQFAPEIARMDSLNATESRGGIVFTGSSSIRKWESLNNDMSPLPVANRGFGGAIIKQVTYQTGKLIVPLSPRLVVFYCGENDIANDKYPAEMPLDDFKAFVKTIRKRLPALGIIFVSLKPSPLRWQYWPKFQRTNELIQDYVAREDKMWYVDVSKPMLGPNGRPKGELFISDSLHMSPAGYELWTRILKPEVAKHYDELSQN